MTLGHEAHPTDELDQPAIFLALSELPEKRATELTGMVASLEPLDSAPLLTPDEETWNPGVPSVLEFGLHRIELMGLDAPLQTITGEEMLERTVGTSYLPQADKERILAHQAHVALMYRGEDPDPIEQHLALFKAAMCFEQQLLGVVNETAWSAIAPETVQGLFSVAALYAIREGIPPLIWTGMIKIPREDDQVWYVSKGHHMFGAPDFVWLGPDLHQAEATLEAFTDLLNHALCAEESVGVGDVAAIGEDYFRFGRLSDREEFYEFLVGDGATLRVDRVPEHVYRRRISGKTTRARRQHLPTHSEPEPPPEPPVDAHAAAVAETVTLDTPPPGPQEGPSGDASLFILAKHKRVLPLPRLEAAREAAAAQNVRLRDYLVGMLDDEVLMGLLRKRERHARPCSMCRGLTYLLPRQTEANTPCEHCGGLLVSA